jgi:hypothetical protein
MDQGFSITEKIQDATKEIHGLVEIIARIRKIPYDVSTKQKDATILVDNEVSARNDSSADKNYTDKEWCLPNGIEYMNMEYGKARRTVRRIEYAGMQQRRRYYRIPVKEYTTRTDIPGPEGQSEQSCAGHATVKCENPKSE